MRVFLIGLGEFITVEIKLQITREERQSRSSHTDLLGKTRLTKSSLLSKQQISKCGSVSVHLWFLLSSQHRLCFYILLSNCDTALPPLRPPPSSTLLPACLFAPFSCKTSWTSQWFYCLCVFVCVARFFTSPTPHVCHVPGCSGVVALHLTVADVTFKQHSNPVSVMITTKHWRLKGKFHCCRCSTVNSVHISSSYLP